MSPTLRSTYRLQFRDGMDFDKAGALVPYWRALGISHLYVSPIFTAAPVSTHGYDVTDPNEIDPALGGAEGFRLFAQTLKSAGLGLILDIVPNHMAATEHNPYFRDLLRHGRNSRYAHYFDIDWEAPRLLLPFLGETYAEALAKGDLRLGLDEGEICLCYHDRAFPLAPETWPADPRMGDVRSKLDAISADKDRLHALHEAQAWRLAYWRLGRDGLTWRRFFEIIDLIGVRMEDETVFDDLHRLLFDLSSEGLVDGVRVDHVDGLADPSGYLDRLAAKLPRKIPIWVEKILEPGEEIPPSWPIAGTTGYEASDHINRLMISSVGASALTRHYEAFRGASAPYEKMKRKAKREVLTRNLAAEYDLLHRLALKALNGKTTTRDFGPDTVRHGVGALLQALPRYRPYLTSPPAKTCDETLLQAAAMEAAKDPELDDPDILDALVTLLTHATCPDARHFRARFQQTSGALMAKAVEDTLFYRYNALIAANEVGGAPDRLDLDIDHFHDFAQNRFASQPQGLTSTATHDTKRGEDARMRLAALAEAPQDWMHAVMRFEEALKPSAPEAETRWLFYQALLGAWEPHDPDLEQRMETYLLKAAREAKRHTSWVRQNHSYERKLAGFVKEAFSSRPFLETFDREAQPFIVIGERKSLAQLALQLFLPGVPDIYQGTEFGDYSMVDPDNRRPVNWQAMMDTLILGETSEGDGFAGEKFALLRFGLALRHQAPHLFEAPYEPISTPNPQLLAFERRTATQILRVYVNLSGRPLNAANLPEAGALGTEHCFPASAAGDLNAALSELGVVVTSTV